MCDWHSKQQSSALHMRFVPDVWVNCATDCFMFRQMAAVRQMELRLVNGKISILFETGCCGRLLFIWYVRWLKIYEKCCNERVAKQFNSNISSFMRFYYRISIYIYTHHPYRICWPGSVVGIATGYGLDGPGIESRCGRDLPHLSRPTLGPTQLPVQWLPGLSRG